MSEQETSIHDFLESITSRRSKADPGAWRKPKEYPATFKRFIRADKYRDSVLAEMKRILEKWFADGVTFGVHSSPLTFVSPVPVYNNAPPKLKETIELAQGAIIWNILIFYKIPLWIRTEVIQVASAFKKPDSDQDEDLWDATFGDKGIGLPLVPVYDTEKDMKHQQKERAEIIANNWYELTVLRALPFIEGAYKEVSKEATQRQIGAIEAFIYLEERLRAMGKVDLEIIEFVDCSRGYKYREVADIQRNFGRSVNPTDIEKNYIETKEALRLDKGQQNEIKAKQDNFRRLLTKLSGNGP